MKVILTLILLFFGLISHPCNAQSVARPKLQFNQNEQCRWRDYTYLIGRDINAVENSELPSDYRIIYKNALRAEYTRYTRLNLIYDENEIIISLSCS